MRDENKNRASDERLSAQVSDILDREFYPNHVSNFKRHNDRKSQVSGIDVSFDYNGHKYLCDEKAAITYRNLATYSFELSFIDKRGEITEGWLTSDKEENNSFLLIWLDDNEGKRHMVDYDEPLDFKKIVVALVRRDTILSYLDELGWTKEKLRKKDERMRQNPDENTGNVRRDGCKFVKTPKTVKPEEPINVILPREGIINMADLVWKTDTATI